MTKENVDQLIVEFGDAIGVEDLRFDETGYVALITEDGMVLNLDHMDDQDCLVMSSTVGEITDEFRYELYDEMLKANFLWSETLGATLCVSPEGGHALLMTSITTGDLDLPKLQNVHEVFVHLTRAWTERINEITGAVEAEDEAEPADHVRPAIPSPNQLA